MELAESVASASAPEVPTRPRNCIRSISSSPWYLPWVMPLDSTRAAVIAGEPIPSPRKKMTLVARRPEALATTTSWRTSAWPARPSERTLARTR